MATIRAVGAHAGNDTELWFAVYAFMATAEVLYASQHHSTARGCRILRQV